MRQQNHASPNRLLLNALAAVHGRQKLKPALGNEHDTAKAPLFAFDSIVLAILNDPSTCSPAAL
jgi:hypothetical protein